MNTDQITGILRAVLAAIGGWAIGKGYIDNGTATMLSGVAVTIGTALWSAWTNKPGTVIPTK